MLLGALLIPQAEQGIATEIALDKPVSSICEVTDQSQKIAVVSNSLPAFNTLHSPLQAPERPLWLLQVKPGA